MLQVVAVAAEVVGQGVEQGRVARRVGGAEVVHRIDDPSAHQVGPDAVDDDFGEVRVLGRGHPVGEGLAGVGVGVVAAGAVPKSGLGGRTSPVSGCLTVPDLGREDDLLAPGDRRREPGPLAADPGEVGGEP